MIVVAIALVLITLKWLDVYTRHGEAVKVPDVRGLGVVDAERLLQKYSLTGLVSDSNYVKDQLPGSVLDVNPAIGQKVKKGSTIYLTVNTGNIPL